MREIYGIEVSPDLITTVTDGVPEEVRAWRARPPEAVYPVLWLDALQVKIKDQGRIANRAIYLAIRINPRGHKEVLGMWGGASVGARILAADCH